MILKSRRGQLRTGQTESTTESTTDVSLYHSRQNDKNTQPLCTEYGIAYKAELHKAGMLQPRTEGEDGYEWPSHGTFVAFELMDLFEDSICQAIVAECSRQALIILDP